MNIKSIAAIGFLISEKDYNHEKNLHFQVDEDLGLAWFNKTEPYLFQLEGGDFIFSKFFVETDNYASIMTLSRKLNYEANKDLIDLFKECFTCLDPIEYQLDMYLGLQIG